MIYLDNGATTLHKPPTVEAAMRRALRECGNPGRGGHPAAAAAGEVVYRCRELAGALFHTPPERVTFTLNCTHGLNIAIRSLFSPGQRVVITGFEHNAVTRPLCALGAQVTVAGRKLFDWGDTLERLEDALKAGADGAVFTHVSNVFGYILPLEAMAGLCRRYGVPFIVDAAQSAGTLPLDLEALGAAYLAMPGHKGLLGPQGTGLLLCGLESKPLLFGGTGSLSKEQKMPEFLPDKLEAGTVNVPGIAGLAEGIAYVTRVGPETILRREQRAAEAAAKGLAGAGYRVFSGPHQSGTLSFLREGTDCEELAEAFSRCGIAMRAGLHCAPTAHESAGTLETGTVRASFGHDAALSQAQALVRAARQWV